MSGRRLRVVEPRPRTPAELVAERFRAIDQFVEKYGMDHWSWDGPPDADNEQLELESEAA